VIGSDTDAWQEYGQQLVSNKAGATLRADLRLPDRFIADLELSWRTTPDFVVALASNHDETDNHPRGGWLVETVDSELLVICEGKQSAELGFVAELSVRSRIRLLVHVDQTLGQLMVTNGRGKQLAAIKSPDGVADGNGIRIVDRRGGLTIERLSVAPWSGFLGDTGLAGDVRVRLGGNELHAGKILGFEDGTVTLATDDKQQEISFQLDDLELADFAAIDAVAPSRPSAQLDLLSGMRLTGEIQQVTPRGWMIAAAHFTDNLLVEHQALQRLTILSETDPQRKAKPTALPKQLPMFGRYRVGRLELDEGVTASKGRIVDSDGEGVIRWQPQASRTASTLRDGVQGQIDYRDDDRETTADRRRSGASSVVPRRMSRDFGQLFLERVGSIQARRARRDQHALHLQTGDVIACRVDGIDPSGVYVSTRDRDDILVAHQLVKAAELVRQAPAPEFSKAKRERILTLPRMLSSAPPTHLLCSHDGDLLRCRVIAMNADSVKVTVQRAELNIPRRRITHVIWLGQHQAADAKRRQEPKGAAPFRGPASVSYRDYIQAVSNEQTRRTVRVGHVENESIFGVDLLGRKVPIDTRQLDRIVIGDAIAAETESLMYADWKLTPAPQPLVMQQSTGSETPVAVSPLVGQPAPEFGLERLDGGGIELSEFADRVVVLDFWASWCAPCVESLPKLQALIGKMDSDQLAMIAINVQERREIVRDAVDRLALATVVGLDQRGFVGELYDADSIPHTVVIDRSGRIAGVFEGGGEKTLARIEQLVRKLIR